MKPTKEVIQEFINSVKSLEKAFRKLAEND
jgi:hypothetical protein